MQQHIFCFGISGIPLSEAACDALFLCASNMLLKRKHEQRLCHDDIYGTVSTSFHRANIGDTFGYVFDAEIATDKGESQTRFIIQDHDKIPRDERKWLRTKIKVLQLDD